MGVMLSCTSETTIDDIRLNGVSVEVKSNGLWTVVNGKYWDKLDADVTCKYLGYREAEASFVQTFYGQGRQSSFSEFKCNGNENTLAECPYRSLGDQWISSIASVKCREEDCKKGKKSKDDDKKSKNGDKKSKDDDKRSKDDDKKSKDDDKKSKDGDKKSKDDD